MGEWGGLIYLILPILLLLLIISRGRKQQRDLVAVQDRVAVGAAVMMASGVFGKVVSIGDDDVIEIELAPGVRTRWTRRAVARVIDHDVATADRPPPTASSPEPPPTGTDPPDTSG